MSFWKYRHEFDPYKMSMHDCKVTRIQLETDEEGGLMTWDFSDGIWLTPEIEQHEITEICRTSEARAVFAGKHLREDDLSAALCIKHRLHGENYRLSTETWEYMTLGEFVSQCKEGEWVPEIICTYAEGRNFLITGQIHTPKKGNWREFRLEFFADTAELLWNEIRPDRVW